MDTFFKKIWFAIKKMEVMWELLLRIKERGNEGWTGEELYSVGVMNQMLQFHIQLQRVGQPSSQTEWEDANLLNFFGSTLSQGMNTDIDTFKHKIRPTRGAWSYKTIWLSFILAWLSKVILSTPSLCQTLWGVCTSVLVRKPNKDQGKKWNNTSFGRYYQ